ncbi:MAG: response regulator transcription factor [Thermoflexibacter sp.]|jgi:DNA-binding NarL/FixJ family response regulator|nr:response regulator transcription factor [Thermoflexibacter sp.]
MKILIADINALKINILEFILRSFIPCEVQRVSNGDELLKQWQCFNPQLIIVDIVLPAINGIEITKKIRNKDKKVNILALSTDKSSNIIQEALKAGVNGFFYSICDFQKFINAVQSIINGHKYIDENIAEEVRSTEIRFTPQEMKVLGLIIEGKNSEEIAEELFVSVATVKFHRGNILQKSDKKNMAQLVRWATLHHII